MIHILVPIMLLLLACPGQSARKKGRRATRKKNNTTLTVSGAASATPAQHVMDSVAEKERVATEANFEDKTGARCSHCLIDELRGCPEFLTCSECKNTNYCSNVRANTILIIRLARS